MEFNIGDLVMLVGTGEQCEPFYGIVIDNDYNALHWLSEEEEDVARCYAVLFEDGVVIPVPVELLDEADDEYYEKFKGDNGE